MTRIKLKALALLRAPHRKVLIIDIWSRAGSAIKCFQEAAAVEHHKCVFLSRALSRERDRDRENPEMKRCAYVHTYIRVKRQPTVRLSVRLSYTSHTFADRRTWKSIRGWWTQMGWRITRMVDRSPGDGSVLDYSLSPAFSPAPGGTVPSSLAFGASAVSRRVTYTLHAFSIVIYDPNLYGFIFDYRSQITTRTRTYRALSRALPPFVAVRPDNDDVITTCPSLFSSVR